MYDIGTTVYVKNIDRLGKIAARGWTAGPPRRAWYQVEFIDLGGQNGRYVTRSSNLRNAEGGCCDGCGRWLPRSSYIGGVHTYTLDDRLSFCFLCVTTDAQEPATL